MDVLTDVLQSVRLRSNVYGRMELTAPWGMRMDWAERPHPSFLVVSRGACWLEVEGDAGPVHLAGGDFVLLPRGRPHVLRDSRETPAVPFEDVLAEMGKTQAECTGAPPVLRYGGGGVASSLVCGCFTFESGGATPLIESLPPMIHVRGDQGAPLRWLEATLQFIAAEAASPMPGAETIRSRLADILFVQAIRVHIASESERPSGWLRALTDPQIGASLHLIHDRPDAPWTVDGLADRVAMSRSSFAERFRALVGVPPLGYLTRWRIHKGASLLAQGDATVAAIAHAVGYETEGSFGKLFKHYTGTSPGEYRAQRVAARPWGLRSDAPAAKWLRSGKCRGGGFVRRVFLQGEAAWLRLVVALADRFGGWRRLFCRRVREMGSFRQTWDDWLRSAQSAAPAPTRSVASFG